VVILRDVCRLDDHGKNGHRVEQRRSESDGENSLYLYKEVWNGKNKWNKRILFFYFPALCYAFRNRVLNKL